MLNDLCTVDGNRLVVSEYGISKVYLINPTDKSYRFLGSINGANGVTYDSKTNHLYACGMGANMDGKGKLYARLLGSKDTGFPELPNSP